LVLNFATFNAPSTASDPVGPPKRTRELPFSPPGGYLDQFLDEANPFGRRNVERMSQPVQLAFNGLDHKGVRVADVEDGDSGHEVDVDVPVHVP